MRVRAGREAADHRAGPLRPRKQADRRLGRGASRSFGMFMPSANRNPVGRRSGCGVRM